MPEFTPVSRVHHADVLVIGGGVAGLSVALGCSERRVTLLAKGAVGRSGSSRMAQGGIAAAVGVDDTPEAHAADTLAVSGGVGDPEVVGLLARDAPRQIRQLATLGAEFDRNPEGELRLGQEAAHSAPRIVHANGDATGAAVMKALGRAVSAAPGVTVKSHLSVEQLIKQRGRVVGVLARTDSDECVAYLATAVVLCTGGIGQAFEATTNPLGVSGEGLAMAAEAGAELADLEFVQFHPTALAVASNPLPLLTEALRGAGSVLVNEHGERFMKALDDRAELAPRDVVARGVWSVLERGGRAFLDARQAARFGDRFPTASSTCARYGLDAAVDLLPVTPAAHFHMGGVATNDSGRTTIPGLWAVGEVACTGAHGANRLASNSLLEGLVFGAKAAQALCREESSASGVRHLVDVSDLGLPKTRDDRELSQELKSLMSRHVGVVRDRKGLAEARRHLAEMHRQFLELREAPPMAWTVAWLVTGAASERRASCGSHFLRDESLDRAEAGGAFRLFAVAREGDPIDLQFERCRISESSCAGEQS